MVSKAYIPIARGTIRLSSHVKEVQEEWDLGEGSVGTCHVSYSRHNLHHLFCSFPLPCCESLLNFGFCPTHPVPVVVSCGDFLVRLSRPPTIHPCQHPLDASCTPSSSQPYHQQQVSQPPPSAGALHAFQGVNQAGILLPCSESSLNGAWERVLVALNR